MKIYGFGTMINIDEEQIGVACENEKEYTIISNIFNSQPNQPDPYKFISNYKSLVSHESIYVSLFLRDSKEVTWCNYIKKTIKTYKFKEFLKLFVESWDKSLEEIMEL